MAERISAHLPISDEVLVDAAPLGELMAAALRGDLPATPPRPDPPTPAGHLALLDATGPVLRQVVKLHAPKWDLGIHRCQGCDFDGYDGEPPTWPCRTVETVAGALGIELEPADG